MVFDGSVSFCQFLWSRLTRQSWHKLSRPQPCPGQSSTNDGNEAWQQHSTQQLSTDKALAKEECGILLERCSSLQLFLTVHADSDFDGVRLAHSLNEALLHEVRFWG